jgi:hypothetical protein
MIGNYLLFIHEYNHYGCILSAHPTIQHISGPPLQSGALAPLHDSPDLDFDLNGNDPASAMDINSDSDSTSSDSDSSSDSTESDGDQPDGEHRNGSLLTKKPIAKNWQGALLSCGIRT